MAKITALDPIDPAEIDGTETLPVVKDGATGRATLANLVQGAIAPFAPLLSSNADAGGFVDDASLVPAGPGNFTVAAASNAFRAASQAMAGVPEGATVSLTYIARGTGDLHVAARNSGTFTSGAAEAIDPDGALHTINLVVPAGGADVLSWFTASQANLEITYFAQRGDIASPVSQAAGLLPEISANIALLRGIGMVTGAATSEVGGFVPESLHAVAWNSPDAFAAITAPLLDVALGETVTLIYRASGASIVSARLFAGAPMSNEPNLLADGELHTATLTATGAANFLAFGVTQGAGRLEYTVIRGAMGQSQDTTLANLLTALAGLIVSETNAIRAGENWQSPDKQILLPPDVYLVGGRETTLYGRNVVRRYDRQNEIETALVVDGPTGFIRPMVPALIFDPARLAGATAVSVQVYDPKVPDQVLVRPLTAHIADAAAAGEINLTVMGDSTTFTSTDALIPLLTAAGLVVNAIGTEVSIVGGIGDGHAFEGRTGWSGLHYIGRQTIDPATSTSGTNPFLRAATADDKAAHPELCFASGAYAYGENRPSYAENPGLGDYWIFDWETWRAQLAIDAAEPLCVVLQLGQNDAGTIITEADLDNVALAQNRIVDNFLATFPNGSITISQETVGAFDDEFHTGLDEWSGSLADIAAKKIELFGGRTADRVHLVPAYAFMHRAFGWKCEVASTDGAGVETQTPIDVIHYPAGPVARQWAEALLGNLLWLQQNGA